MISAEEVAANLVAAGKSMPTTAEVAASLQRAGEQLFPRPSRRLKAPRKAELYQMVRELAEDNAKLRAENDQLRTPWWRRIFRRKAA